MARSITITFDANDVDTLVEFWGTALGYEMPDPPPDFETWDDFAAHHEIPEDDWNSMSALEDPDGAGPRLLFLKVPEGKTAKNRVHLDVHTDRSLDRDARVAQQDELCDELVAAGATVVGRVSDHSSTWIVCHDPEGNEFCIV